MSQDLCRRIGDNDRQLAQHVEQVISRGAKHWHHGYKSLSDRLEEIRSCAQNVQSTLKGQIVQLKGDAVDIENQIKQATQVHMLLCASRNDLCIDTSITHSKYKYFYRQLQLINLIFKGLISRQYISITLAIYMYMFMLA